MSMVKCVLGYFDTKLNRHVDIDEEIEVTDERAAQLIKAKVAVTTATPKKVGKKTRKKEEV